MLKLGNTISINTCSTWCHIAGSIQLAAQLPPVSSGSPHWPTDTFTAERATELEGFFFFCLFSL